MTDKEKEIKMATLASCNMNAEGFCDTAFGTVRIVIENPPVFNRTIPTDLDKPITDLAQALFEKNYRLVSVVVKQDEWRCPTCKRPL